VTADTTRLELTQNFRPGPGIDLAPLKACSVGLVAFAGVLTMPATPNRKIFTLPKSLAIALHLCAIGALVLALFASGAYSAIIPN